MDSLGLKIVSRTDHKLYTNITVDIGVPPANQPEVAVSYQSVFWYDSFGFVSVINNLGTLVAEASEIWLGFSAL